MNIEKIEFDFNIDNLLDSYVTIKTDNEFYNVQLHCGEYRQSLGCQIQDEKGVEVDYEDYLDELIALAEDTYLKHVEELIEGDLVTLKSGIVEQKFKINNDYLNKDASPYASPFFEFDKNEKH